MELPRVGIVCAALGHLSDAAGQSEKAVQQYGGSKLLPTEVDGWSATLAFAMDRGNYWGNSMGAMLTVRKTGGFGK